MNEHTISIKGSFKNVKTITSQVKAFQSLTGSYDQLTSVYVQGIFQIVGTKYGELNFRNEWIAVKRIGSKYLFVEYGPNVYKVKLLQSPFVTFNYKIECENFNGIDFAHGIFRD